MKSKKTLLRKIEILKNAMLIAGMAMLIAGCGAAGSSKEDKTMSEQLSLSNVTINTTVRKTGQYPEEFILSFDREIPVKEPDPASLLPSRRAGCYGRRCLHGMAVYQIITAYLLNRFFSAVILT